MVIEGMHLKSIGLMEKLWVSLLPHQPLTRQWDALVRLVPFSRENKPQGELLMMYGRSDRDVPFMIHHSQGKFVLAIRREVNFLGASSFACLLR